MSTDIHEDAVRAVIRCDPMWSGEDIRDPLWSNATYALARRGGNVVPLSAF